MYIGDTKILNSYFITPVGLHKFFTAVHSYNGHFFVGFNIDTSIECDIPLFTKLVEETLENYLKV